MLEDSHHLIEDEWVDEWIDENVADNGREVTVKNAVSLTKDKVHRFWKSEKEDVKEKFSEVFGQTVKQEELLLDRATGIFSDEAEEKNKGFAFLTQMRNTFGPSSVPKKMNQGTIVQADRYYVCVQPRCDTGRFSVKKDGDRLVRPFLFLPLSETGRGVAIVVDDMILRVENVSHQVESFPFSPEDGKTDIVFKERDGKLCAEDKEGNSFIWKGELKELQSQRINANYSYELSRVGLDESEWLRLKGGKK